MGFNETVTKLALEAGGAHYPEVNRMQLDAYTKLVIKECLQAVDDAGRAHVYTTFDQGQFEASLESAKQSINKRFGL